MGVHAGPRLADLDQHVEDVLVPRAVQLSPARLAEQAGVQRTALWTELETEVGARFEELRQALAFDAVLRSPELRAMVQDASDTAPRATREQIDARGSHA